MSFTSFFGLFTLFLVYSNGQMRPQNWDLDILKFDQRDWDKFGQDLGQNSRPFPSFRSNKIPTQQPPIVGQIPGQIGKGQRGQSGNDNDPPPLPPMPQQPSETPTVPNTKPGNEKPPPMLPDPGTDLEETSPTESSSSDPTSRPENDNQPLPSTSIPPGQEIEPPVPEVEVQSELPPSEQPLSPDEAVNGDGVNPTEMEGFNESEASSPMKPTPPSSEEKENTTVVDRGMQIPGFTFGRDIGQFPEQIGKSVPTTVKKEFRFPGEEEVLTKNDPPGVPGGEIASQLEYGDVIAMPNSSLEQDVNAVASGLPRNGSMGKYSYSFGSKETLSTPLPIVRSNYQGMGKKGA